MTYSHTLTIFRAGGRTPTDEVDALPCRAHADWRIGLYSDFRYAYSTADAEVTGPIVECALCNQTDLNDLTLHELEILADHPTSAYALIANLEQQARYPVWKPDMWTPGFDKELWQKSINNGWHLTHAIYEYMPERFDPSTRNAAAFQIAETILNHIGMSDGDDDAHAVDIIDEYAQRATLDTLADLLKVARADLQTQPDSCHCERCPKSNTLIEDCECHNCLVENADVDMLDAFNCVDDSECELFQEFQYWTPESAAALRTS